MVGLLIPGLPLLLELSLLDADDPACRHSPGESGSDSALARLDERTTAETGRGLRLRFGPLL